LITETVCCIIIPRLVEELMIALDYLTIQSLSMSIIPVSDPYWS
jgi:hypothetical protein